MLGILQLDLLIGLLIVMTSGLVRGFTGFAGALVNVPLLTLLWGPVEAIAIATLTGIASQVQLSAVTFRKTRWGEVIPLSVAALIFTPVGAIALVHADPQLIRRVIGALVAAGALLMMIGWVWRGQRNWPVSALVGALCGGMQGMSGINGPPLIAYMLAAPELPDVQRANIIAAIGLMIAVMFFTLLLNGAFGWTTVGRALILFPATLLGTWAGNWAFQRAPQAIYRKVALGLLIITGLAVLVF